MSSNIIFFGTSDFAVPILEKLARSGFRPALVVTTPDAPAGRKKVLTPPPVKLKAEKLGLEVYQPQSLNADEAIERIKLIQPDVGVIAAYGKIIPKAVIELFPRGILNVHPSLLPRWRGPTPIQSAILAGDEKTGVTIMLVDEEMDHGPIVVNREWKIENRETYVSLHDKLAELGADLLIETLPKWLAGNISPAPQDHTKVTYSKIFTRQDAKIDWSKSAEDIDRMVRALNPEPGTWTRYSDKRQATSDKELKIIKAQPFSNSRELENKKVGEIFMHEGLPAVRCGKGAVMLETVQPEGKTKMPGADFLRGHQSIIGAIFR